MENISVVNVSKKNQKFILPEPLNFFMVCGMGEKNVAA